MMSEWIKHNGKGMPVSAETMVSVKLRGGFEDHGAVPAGYWHCETSSSNSNWRHYDDRMRDYDIIAYRIVP